MIRQSTLLIAVALFASAPSLAQDRAPRPATPPQVVDPFREDAPRPTRETDSRKVDLRPRFEKGQIIRFRMELDQKNRTVMPALDDKPTESTSNQELGLVFTVKEANDDATVVELSFSRVKLSKKTDDETEEFDSNQSPSRDKNSPSAPSLRALTKAKFTLHLDRDGNLTHIEGGDELMALDAFGGAPGLNPGSLPGLPASPPAGGAGGAAIKEALGSIFSIKKGPGLVSVGEEWTNTDVLDTGLLGRFKITDKHKLKSHNGREAKVSVIGYMEPDSGAGDCLSLVKITDSSFVGDYTWSTSEGMLRRMNMHQHVVLETSAAGGLTLTSDMKSVVTRVN